MSRTNPIIFDESNYKLLLPDASGSVPANRGGGESRVCALAPKPKGAKLTCVMPFADTGIPLVPRSQWAERIAAMERTKTRLSDIYKRQKLPVQNQNGFGWCHAYSPVNAIMLLRAIQNQPYKRLSEASVAGPVTNWRNEGAWIGQDLEQITRVGCAEWEMVPEFCTNSRKAKEGWEENAAQYCVVEWAELPSRNFDAVMACLFARLPVCVGLNWWGHAVTYHDPIKTPSGYGVRFLNSWSGDYEDGGWGMLAEGRANPDEAYAPISIKWVE